MRLLILFAVALSLAAQSRPEIQRPQFEIPTYVQEKLSASDRVLFEKLTRVGLESVWSQLQSRGYTHSFINELDAVHSDRRLIGRARTIRYLPTRPDLREEIYSKQKQLNYVSAEESQPGDVLVFDAGGDTRSAVSGDVTTLRFLVRGGPFEAVEGQSRSRNVVIEFPSYQAALDCYHSETYQAARAHRTPVSTATITLIEGIG